MSWADKVNNVLGICTSAGAFGQDLTHTTQGGASQVFKGIWSDVYLTVEPETGIQIMSSEPNIGARLKDFTNPPAKHDSFYKGEVEYRARAIEPDGEGGITIVLEKVV